MPSAAPARFADRTLAGYQESEPSDALAAAWRVARGELANLVLLGPTGVGKTHLAAGIVNAIANRQRSAYEDAVAAMDPADGPYARWPAEPEYPLWCNVADLIVGLRLDMNRPIDDRDASRQASRIRSHRGLVVLDDLGREKVSDWTAETIYSLVNARYEALLPTVVTSNLSPAELRQSPYWPILSRLAEDGLLVAIDRPDHRLEVVR